jgi:hypothetical protein
VIDGLTHDSSEFGESPADSRSVACTSTKPTSIESALAFILAVVDREKISHPTVSITPVKLMADPSDSGESRFYVTIQGYTK